jgi:hypothetical protein
MNSPCGDHAVLVRRVSAIAVLATDLGGGMAEGIVGVRAVVRVVGICCCGESGGCCDEKRSNAVGGEGRGQCAMRVTS